MTLSQQVQEAIQKELPNMVASELQQFIKEAENTKDKLVRVEADHRTLNDFYKASQARIKELEDLKLDAEKNKKDRQDIEEMQRNLRVTLAENEAKAAVNRSQDIFNLVEKVFRNAEVRKSIHEIVPLTTHYNNGNGNVSTMANNYEQKKQTTEEQV